MSDAQCMTASGDVVSSVNGTCLYYTNGSFVGMISKEMLCVGSDQGSGSCMGDSGGPFTVKQDGKHFLVGVVSWGFGCADVS